MRALCLLTLAGCVASAPPSEIEGAAVNARTEVVTDEHGWPHVSATSLRDLGFAQGYAMARDRMAQLELFRRTANGRLAEVFGTVSSKFIESDVTMRTIGLRRMGQLLWERCDDRRMRELFEGYAAGVNQYLAQVRSGQVRAPRGSELLVGSMTPEWSPVDSLTVLRLMEMFLAFNADAEINRSLLRDRARVVFDEADPAEAPELAARRGFFAQVMQFAPPSPATTVPGFYAAGAKTGGRGRSRRAPSVGASALALSSLRRVLPAQNRLGVGTNAWALSGASTASGHALLANDPHLPLIAPTILWGVHLVVSEGPDAMDVTGVAFAGVPGVVFGHNARVAWGITNAMFDQMDVYEETLTADAASFRGQWVPLEKRVEHIPNGLGGTLDVTVETVPHHGPILPVFEREGGLSKRTGTRAISVRWVAAEPSHEVEGLIALMLARDVREAEGAVRDIEVPGMGFVFADSAGDIAFRMTGKLPIRAPGAMTWDPVKRPDGTMPATVLPGTGEAEWVGWLDPDQLPHAAPGTRAFIAAANNDPAGSSRDGNPFDERVYLGYDWSEGFRAERLTQRLGELVGTATRADMEALQADVTVLAARRFMPYLVDHSGASEELAARLRGWDLRATEASVEAAVFHAWLARLLDFSLSDEVEALGDTRGVVPVLAPGTRMTALAALLENADSPLWDDLTTPGITETRDAVMARALTAALADLEKLTGSADVAKWRWGPLHTVRFDSVIPHFSLSLGADLSVPPHGEPAFARGGGIDTVDQGWPVLQDERGRPAPVFAYTQGPARRLSIELTPDGPVAFDALPGGESGDLGSSHFRDEAELWRTNRSHPLWRTRAEIDAHAEARTVFTPR
ncbi:MAG: penicillin acylase family protein [Archangiaceae bacterium]|nr:penicillin acylase family protein [Archangiaceae bacterium]